MPAAVPRSQCMPPPDSEQRQLKAPPCRPDCTRRPSATALRTCDPPCRGQRHRRRVLHLCTYLAALRETSWPSMCEVTSRPLVHGDLRQNLRLRTLNAVGPLTRLQDVTDTRSCAARPNIGSSQPSIARSAKRCHGGLRDLSSEIAVELKERCGQAVTTLAVTNY